MVHDANQSESLACRAACGSTLQINHQNALGCNSPYLLFPFGPFLTFPPATRFKLFALAFCLFLNAFPVIMNRSFSNFVIGAEDGAAESTSIAVSFGVGVSAGVRPRSSVSVGSGSEGVVEGW